MFKGLKNKSILNLDAAEVLIKSPNYHHCASVHCSYFSCLQVLKYILLTILNEKEEEIYTKRNAGIYKLGEHEYFIQRIHEQFLQGKDYQNASVFKNKIIELKSIRVVSDYKNDSIEIDKSDYALSLAKEILTLLKRKFKYE